MKKSSNSVGLSRSIAAPVQPESVLSVDDVITVLTLGSLWILALVFPRKFWPMVASVCANIHIWAQMPDLRAATDSLKREGVEISERALARDLLTGNYLENIETMSEYLGYRSDSTVEVRGVKHISRALELGRGAILWRTPFCGSALFSRAVQVLTESNTDSQDV